MAIPSRTRKRVQATIPRGTDGSAFQKCDMCGDSVAIALADMHECRSSQGVKKKKFKGIRVGPTTKNAFFIPDKFKDQPRSAFCFFMEEFKAMRGSDDPIETDRNGFTTWTKMSNEERQPYKEKAAIVNFRFDKALRDEEENRSYKPDAEATKTSNWVQNLWEDYSGSGWHTYVDHANHDHYGHFNYPEWLH